MKFRLGKNKAISVNSNRYVAHGGVIDVGSEDDIKAIKALNMKEIKPKKAKEEDDG